MMNTGRKDMNGVSIKEMDVVNVQVGKDIDTYIVKFEEGVFVLANDNEVIELSYFDDSKLKVMLK